MLLNRIFWACPACYHRITLPIYACPGCGSKHKRLIPGNYGIFLRRCGCGVFLPTTTFLGRRKLTSLCPRPRCGAQLNAAIGEERSIYLNIAGGGSAGKTTFLMASLAELKRSSGNGRPEVSFPEERYEKVFDANLKVLESGGNVRKTAELSAEAFLFSLKHRRGQKTHFYAYDNAGELFEQYDTMRGHEYYDYSHAIFLLIDPFSIPRVRLDLGQELKRQLSSVMPSEQSPQGIYGKVLGRLHESTSPGGSIDVPLAVILTKVDACGLEWELEQMENQARMEKKTRDRGHYTSQAVRRWLCEKGEENLVLSIEADFRMVRYFRISATGGSAGSGKPAFAPHRVLEPLAWALRFRGIKIDPGNPPI